MKPGFCIGNGESRKGVDLARLALYGPVYGCNHLYTEYSPTALYTVHDWIAEKARTAYQGIIVCPPHLHPGAHEGWSTGPTSIEGMSLEESVDHIFLLGHDLYPTEPGKLNDIYKTLNSHMNSDQEHVYENWVSQIDTILRECPFHQFYRVGREQDPMPKHWKAAGNMKFISYPEMWALLDVEASNVST